MKLANEVGCSVTELGIDAENLAGLANMVGAGQVSATASAIIFEEMAKSKKAPDIIAARLNLIQTSDAGELEAIVDDVLAANPKAVADVTSGGKKTKKALGFLTGQVMQKSKGQANPKVVAQILNKKLA